MPITVPEEAVQARGRALAARMTGDESTLFSTDWWGGKLLNWAMADEATKVALFRFIDALPSLSSPAEVVRHLQQYLGRPEVKVPGFLSWGLERLEPTGMLARRAANQVEKNVAELARRFIVGETPRDSLPRLRALWDAGRLATVDLLGEACLSEAEADEYQARYLEILSALNEEMATWTARPGAPEGLGPPLNISVKPSSLAPYLEPAALEASVERIFARLLPIAQEARSVGAFINLDMEQVHLKEITFELYRRLLEEPTLKGYDGFGLAVQAYLKETEDDLAGLLAWARQGGYRIAIRLVRGAYWDYETISARLRSWPSPVYTEKAATDAFYERCVRLLLEHVDEARVAFATHNLRSIAYCLAAAEAAGLDPGAWEVQTLYGMAEPLKVALSLEGVALREYAPIGELLPGMAYLVRRLLENTSSESILTRKFPEEEAVETILVPPAPAATAETHPVPPEDLGDPATWRPFANEPPADFAKSEARDAFARALEAGEAAFGATLPILVDGEPIETETPLLSFNPAREGVVVGRTFAAGPAEADRAVDAARAGAEAWGARPASERGAILRRAADILRLRGGEIAALAVHEVSKTWAEADADVAEAIDFCEYYAREMVRLDRPQRLGGLAGEENEYRYQPRGVAVVISPWNFPVAIPAGMVAAALVAGNAVVFKPSERSPITAARLVEIFHAAGAPKGALHYLPGDGAVGARLVRHPGVALIAFTGSKRVGLEIVEAAAHTPEGQAGVKKVVAEMGGKNAIIVDADADLDQAVAGVVTSAFGYQGQKCSACSRAIVVGAAHEPFLARLTEAARSLAVGDPADPSVQLGAVIDARARQTIEAYIAKGRSEAVCCLEVDPPAGGSYVGPVIFTDAAPDATVATEEIFGPVLTLFRARDFDEALELANASPYRLTGGVYSRDPAHLEAARRSFRVGNLYINRPITGALVGRQPFGGFGMSGVGSKAGGPDYLLQFLEPVTISENTIRRGFAPTPQPEDSASGRLRNV